MTIQVNDRVIDVDEKLIDSRDVEQVNIRVDEKRVKKFAKAALGDSFTHDNYFAKMMSDEKTARLFFELFLPKRVLRQVDLETLRSIPTKNVDENGKFSVGDMFYSLEMKRRKGKKTRRAVFMLILEHKSEHERYVSIQLLNYIAGMLRFMGENPGSYQDEHGLLPAPYAMVFSQARKPWKRVPYLGRILWTIRGLRRTIPNFIFPVVEARDVPLEKIKSLELRTRAFLYLERLAKSEYEKGENQELIALFSELLKASSEDERLRQAFIASVAYFRYLQKGRLHTMSMLELENGLYEANDLDEDEAVAELFSKAFERKSKQKYEQGFEQGRVLSIYDIIFNNYVCRYESDFPGELEKKVSSINYYPALEEIQLAILKSASSVAFERQVNSIIEKYADEIKALSKNERGV